MPAPPYRQYQTKHLSGSATYVQHDDGRRVLVGFGIPNVHYLERQAAQRWVDQVDGVTGPWVTAADLLRSLSP